MKAPQLNLLATGQSVSDVLETITATDVPAALTASHAALKTTLNTIQTLAMTQALPTQGVTQDRDTVFRTAADATRIVAGLVLGYAKAKNLGDLASKVDLLPTQLNYGRRNVRVQLMQQVHDAAATVVGQLADYEVTAATLTDLQTKIDAASGWLSEPRGAIVNRRVATEKLAETHDRLESLLHEQIDPLMEARRTTDPDGYKLYRAARLVINRPGSSPAEPAAATAATANAPAASSPMSNVTKLAA